MQQKTNKVDSLQASGDMDLDQMIKEGEEKHVKNKELAQQQVLKMQAEDNFDFKLDGVDMF